MRTPADDGTVDCRRPRPAALAAACALSGAAAVAAVVMAYVEGYSGSGVLRCVLPGDEAGHPIGVAFWALLALNCTMLAYHWYSGYASARTIDRLRRQLEDTVGS
jgi:hypothetical protein